jgi:hypothetical protein
MKLIENMMNIFGKMLKYADQLLKTNGKMRLTIAQNHWQKAGNCWGYTVYVIFGHIHILHNLIFPLKMLSNCESMDVFQPTELWTKKVIM